MSKNEFVELVEDYLFEINKLGVVRNKQTGHILKQSINGNRIYINLPNANRKPLIYLLAQNFIDNPNNFEYVLQIDRDPKNISLDNIVWCNKETSHRTPKTEKSSFQQKFKSFEQPENNFFESKQNRKENMRRVLRTLDPKKIL